MLTRAAISFGPGVVILRYIWYCDPEFFLLARSPYERCMRILRVLLMRPRNAANSATGYCAAVSACLPACLPACLLPACLLLVCLPACLLARLLLFFHARRCRPSPSDACAAYPLSVLSLCFAARERVRSLCCSRCPSRACLRPLLAFVPARARFCSPACAMIDDWRVPLAFARTLSPVVVLATNITRCWTVLEAKVGDRGP